MKNVFGNLKNVKLDKIIESFKNASPELLIAGGIISMFTAGVLAIKNSSKARDEIEEKEAMYEADGKEMPKTDKIIVEAKHQVPSIVLFATGTIAIIGSNRIQNRRNVALALALQAGQTYATELETKLKKLVGVETVEKAKSEIDEEKRVTCTRVVDANSPVMKIRDNFTGAEFYSNISAVRDAVDEVNKMLVNGECVSVKNFYEILAEPVGITEANKRIGWTANDKYGGFLLSLDWTTELEGCSVVATFDYEQEPTSDFWG